MFTLQKPSKTGVKKAYDRPFAGQTPEIFAYEMQVTFGYLGSPNEKLRHLKSKRKYALSIYY